jgi:predicted anti-sigma-YlaC factor YlaD
MRCAAAKRLISDYVDGGLAGDEQARLKGHLEACPSCQELLRDFEKIVEEEKKIPALEPSPLAWQRVASGVEHAGEKTAAFGKERQGWFVWTGMPAGLRYALAAALALAVISSGLILGLRSRGTPGSESFALAKLKEAQHHYMLAIKALDAAIGAQKNGLDPRLAEVFKRNLQDVNETIQACDRLIQKDPNNLAVRAYLLSIYKEKVTLLEEMMGAKKASSEKRIGLTL